MMKIEIEMLGNTVKVRIANSSHSQVKIWDDIFPGQRHTASKLTYEELISLGNGIHPVGDCHDDDSHLGQN